MAFTNVQNLLRKMNILFLLNVITCSLAVIEPATRDRQDCAQHVAVQVAEKYYGTNQPTMTWSKTASENDPLQYFHSRYRGCLLSVEFNESEGIARTSYSKNIPHHITQYVIFIDRVKHFEYFVSQIKNESIFANYGKFIIICKDDAETGHGCIAEVLFDICWRHYVANVIFLHHAPSGQVTISTYFPMEDGLCNNIKPKVLDTVTTCSDYRCLHEPFPLKFNNFNGCPLILSVTHFPPFEIITNDTQGVQRISGVEGNLHNVLSKMINATLEVRKISEGSIFNGTHWTGSLGDLIMQRSNLTMALYLFLDTAHTFRWVYPQRTGWIGWVSPPVPLRPAWEKLIKPFDFQLRVLFTIAILVTILMLVILKETRLESTWNKLFTNDVINSNLYINTCAIFFGQAAARRPTKAALTLSLALWIWFSFFMLNAYQGALISVLKRDVYISDLDTVSGAIKAGYEFGGLSELRAYFTDNAELYDRYKAVELGGILNYLEPVANGSLHLIFQIPLSIVPFYNLEKNRTNLFHVIPDDIKQQYVTYYLPSDSPLEETLSWMYARLAASGLFYIQEIAESLSAKRDISKRHSNESDGPLTMHHMQACFFVVIGGWLLSLMLIFVEVIWYKHDASKNSKRCSHFELD